MACKVDSKDTKLEVAVMKVSSEALKAALPSVQTNAAFDNFSDRVSSLNSALSMEKQVANQTLVKVLLEQNPDSLKPFREITLPQSTLVDISKASAVGKRLLVIDKSSYGPSLEQRNQDENAIINAQGEIDSFRLVSAKYWASSEDKKSLVYLKDEGIKHKILNYTFGGGVAKIADVKVKNGLRVTSDNTFTRDFSSFDNTLNRVTQQDPNILNQSIFSTQQNILISSRKESFMVNKVGTSNNVNKQVNNNPTLIGENKKFALSNNQKIGYSEYSPEFWRLYVNGGTSKEGKMYPSLFKLNEDFYDYNFEMPIPFLKKDIENGSFLVTPLLLNCSFNYDFYMKEYEDKTKEAPENVLPNFYIFEMEMSRETNNNDYLKLITLGGALDTKDAIITPPLRVVDYRELNKKYFNLLGAEYTNIIRIGQDTSINKQKIENIKAVEKAQTNIGIPVDNLEILDKYYNYRVMFPMHVDLQFSTDKTTVVSNILHDCRLDKSLMKDIIIGDNNKYEIKSLIEEIEIMAQTSDEVGNSLLNRGYSLNNSNRRVWDVTKWMSDIKEKETKIKDGLILYKEDDTGDEQESEIVKNLFRIIFVGKMKKFVKDKFRTYEEMINGKLAYSETAMYKIEKSLADANGNRIGEPIQTYYVSNGNEIDMLKLVDTQVKYNTRYRYDVFAYQLVIGTKYRYTNKQVADESMSVSVIQVPSIILVEVPYCSYSDIMLDSPPVRPNVEIVPYKGIDNKILFFLCGNVGDYQEVPIIIDAEDRARIEDYKRSKKIGVNEPIRFKSDDQVSTFQIFRTDMKPKSYSDFANKLLITVQTDISPLTAQSATSAAYVDIINPNKKYWFCFRSVDNHGHLSQPTEVFQVEMINDHGMIYPIIQVFDMEKEKEEKKPSKPMKRYLYIAPTMLQKLLNEDKSGLTDLDSVKDYDPKKMWLGVKEKVVWGNSYKIRLTSKKTGKKIDINISTDYEGIRKEKII